MTTLPATIRPHNHFTPDLRARFCEALSLHGNIRAACKQMGINSSTAYRAKQSCPHFRLAWDAALVLARDHAEAVLAERALDGVEETIFYHGEPVATRRRFDSRLLLAHLARLDTVAAHDDAMDAAVDFARTLELVREV